MFNPFCGFAVFLLAIVTGAAVLMFGPDAGFTATQGSVVLFVSMLGMLGGVVIINGGKL